MGLWTRYFLRCDRCDYVYFLQSITGQHEAPKEWIYSEGSQEFFPLVRRLGWCLSCAGIQFHEHIPTKDDIDSSVDKLRRQLHLFESGELPWYGIPRANHARMVVATSPSWHQWSKSRPRGRCLACGTEHVMEIAPSLLEECKGPLPFAHPGCGGALICGSDEEGMHVNGKRFDPNHPISYLSYSYAGFPSGAHIDQFWHKLEAKHPGATLELRTAVANVASGKAMAGSALTFRSLSGQASQAQLGAAIFDFICRELEDRPPDPGAPDSLSSRFPEVHALAALLIRDLVFKLPPAQRSRPIAPARPPKTAVVLTTAIHRSPFYLLSVSTRDDRRRIVAQAEERALHLDAETCQKARADLTNPRTRLSAEVAWLPGISPRRASALVETLKSLPWDIRGEDGLPALAKANLLAAASEAIDEKFSSDEVSEFIHNFALLVEDIDPGDVLRSINEDRAVSGFPEVRDIDLIEAELTERKRYYRNAIKAALNRLNSPELLAAMTMVVDNATLGGQVHAPELIDELVDAYAVETQGVLSKESQNADRLIRAALESAKVGEAAVRPMIDKLESVARTWDKIARPIQLSSKARGLEHEPSKQLAYSIRSFAIDLFNEHDLLVQSQRLTKLLSELFAELPEFVERVSADAQALSKIAMQRQKSEREQRQWEEEIAFNADVGAVFKDSLSISAKGISWKDEIYPLSSITRVRWGGVRHSVNGIPTGTDYTVAFGDNRTESVVSIKREATYTKFTDKLWRAVCVRLMTDILKALKDGSEVQFGKAAVRDEGITLIKHKFFGSNEAVRYLWAQVHIWSSDGAFVIGAKDDKKVHVSLSYIDVPNVHILEQMIRMAFKQSGLRRLSELLG
jgi:hypothetical protein